MGKLTPPQLLIFSFLCVIIIGTVVLSFPAAVQSGERLSLIDSCFTATSAVCVTGLTVKDTASCFSGAGKWVIFLLFQAGGLGIMTFSTLFAVLLGRKIGFYQTDIIRTTLDKRNIFGLKKLIAYILTITITVEAIGSVFLFLRWKNIAGWNLFETAERALFHSVSGFCNAGFSLFNDSLTQFQADPYTNLIMMLLIFLGGIGFIVIVDVLGLFYKKGSEKRISLQSKIALTVTAILILAGTLLILFFEKDNLMKVMSWPERSLTALFQSVTARTAGFNTMPTSGLSVPSLVSLIFLMFIGASPGSTGGGIKTCTLAVIGATVYAMFKNKRRTMLFKRSIPRRIIREALVIFFLAISWIFVVTVLITFSETGRAGGNFLKALFEVVSAFGTVGLSTGITGTLNSFSKVCIIATMFAGRVGPLTLALAVAFKERKDSYFFPEEDVMVG
ncbi:MAG: TrkH family potassium uptake protein [Candidatus Omnitrophota bacterium]|nr:TrkH family potassium uptake protein [Candidatus Omnitrophota bacterium]MBU1894739.1 TrkH family potassium uptake protein [Candidatus Omnitrophota bacterium]